MKIAVIHPECSKESAITIAKAINGEAINPFKTNKRDFTAYDLVINYGCNRNIKANAVFNTSKAIAQCIDKLKTLGILSRNLLPCPKYVTNKVDIPKQWKYIVVREEIKGNKHEGMSIFHRNQMKKIPHAPLYTEFFEHKKEFRITVFNKLIAISYEKELIEGEWHLIEKKYKYLSPVKEACINAAKALNIDFIGFDVLINANNEFVILEANSAPIISEETLALFKNYVRKQRNGFQ